MILDEKAVIDIEAAEYVQGYKLHVVFSDGKDRVIDFGHFLCGSLNPMIRKYLDLDDFKGFSTEHGDLFWDDYDLCFPIADLYEGRI